MKFTCSKSKLLTGVQTVAKAVPSKTTMSILECILIEADNGNIILTANDMELGIETVIEGDVKVSGKIALDAKIFLEIVRKLPDNNITIETDDNNKTTITCEKAKFNIIGKSGDDFSCLPAVEKREPLVISQYTLKESIRQTIFSISDNESNKIMTGELFEINDNEFKVIPTCFLEPGEYCFYYQGIVPVGGYTNQAVFDFSIPDNLELAEVKGLYRKGTYVWILKEGKPKYYLIEECRQGSKGFYYGLRKEYSSSFEAEFFVKESECYKSKKELKKAYGIE